MEDILKFIFNSAIVLTAIKIIYPIIILILLLCINYNIKYNGEIMEENRYLLNYIEQNTRKENETIMREDGE